MSFVTVGIWCSSPGWTAEGGSATYNTGAPEALKGNEHGSAPTRNPQMNYYPRMPGNGETGPYILVEGDSREFR